MRHKIETLIKQAAAYQKNGQPEGAMRALEQAEALSRSHRILEGEVRLAQATVHALMGNERSAVKRVREALRYNADLCGQVEKLADRLKRKGREVAGEAMLKAVHAVRPPPVQEPTEPEPAGSTKRNADPPPPPPQAAGYELQPFRGATTSAPETRGEVPSQDTEVYALAGDFKTCPYCGEAIRGAAVKCKHCGETLGGRGGPPAYMSPSIPERGPRIRAGAIICNVCSGGTMVAQNKHRMSPPVVVIGYILLIPSILGMALCIGTCLFTTGATAQGNNPTADGATAAVIGGGALCGAVSSFVGGLFGWLLVMKKKVLQCTNCGAVVAAS